MGRGVISLRGWAEAECRSQIAKMDSRDSDCPEYQIQVLNSQDSGRCRRQHLLPHYSAAALAPGANLPPSALLEAVAAIEGTSQARHHDGHLLPHPTLARAVQNQFRIRRIHASRNLLSAFR